MNDMLGGNPGKSGHLCNQDTFSGPQGVRIIQVPLYTTIGPQGSYVCTRTDKLSQSNTPWASKQTSDYRGCQIIQCFLKKLNIVIDRPSEYGQIWKNVGLLRCRITGGPLHRHVWSQEVGVVQVSSWSHPPPTHICIKAEKYQFLYSLH